MREIARPQLARNLKFSKRRYLLAGGVGTMLGVPAQLAVNLLLNTRSNSTGAH
jgi:hypothetical protein